MKFSIYLKSVFVINRMSEEPFFATRLICVSFTLLYLFTIIFRFLFFFFFFVCFFFVFFFVLFCFFVLFVCFFSAALRGVRQIIDTESATVLSLAVDWLLGILFWTETFPAKLRTSSLSGRQVTTVLSDNMENPVCLTLDPAEGYVPFPDSLS